MYFLGALGIDWIDGLEGLRAILDVATARSQSVTLKVYIHGQYLSNMLILEPIDLFHTCCRPTLD